MTHSSPGAASEFPRRVRAVRKALGFSQGRFADELGVTLLTVHRWEAGKAAPHRASLRRLAELEERVAAAARTPARSVELGPPPLDFAGNPEAISAFAEALCLIHGHEFNPAFAIETARIDPLPHQRIAVYERMLAQDPLRFLLADDAGAGKTIMTGLLVRELLFRERIRRVLIVPPAGLVGNWERELRTLFRLRFGNLRPTARQCRQSLPRGGQATGSSSRWTPCAATALSRRSATRRSRPTTSSSSTRRTS